MTTKICHRFSARGQYAGCKCDKQSMCIRVLLKETALYVHVEHLGQILWPHKWSPNNLFNKYPGRMLSYFLSFCVLACAACLSLCYDTATCTHQQINFCTPLHISTWWWPCIPYHAHNACSPGYVHMCTCPLVRTHTLVYLGQKRLTPQDYTYLAHLRYVLILILNQLQCDSVGLWAVHERVASCRPQRFHGLQSFPSSFILLVSGLWDYLLSRTFTQWNFKSRYLFSKQN